FTVLEQMSGELNRQTDVKYFHFFKNGACYEFALDVETSRKTDDDLAQVDRGKVFQQLARILTSARIKDVELPGVESAQKTTLPDLPATDSKTENAQVFSSEKTPAPTAEQK
ncbi:MAG TPA: hypothetical protein VGU90_17870, partial [Terriglobales bacterium]|nr:hypothetical protein [Terriglobales bacterium]